MVDGTASEGNERFAFGANWTDFNRAVGDDQLQAARAALARLLDSDDLTGKTFLDVGCGSGLHALTAHQMGQRSPPSTTTINRSVRP